MKKLLLILPLIILLSLIYLLSSPETKEYVIYPSTQISYLKDYGVPDKVIRSEKEIIWEYYLPANNSTQYFTLQDLGRVPYRKIMFTVDGNTAKSISETSSSSTNRTTFCYGFALSTSAFTPIDSMDKAYHACYLFNDIAKPKSQRLGLLIADSKEEYPLKENDDIEDEVFTYTSYWKKKLEGTELKNLKFKSSIIFKSARIIEWHPEWIRFESDGHIQQLKLSLFEEPTRTELGYKKNLERNYNKFMMIASPGTIRVFYPGGNK